MEKACNLAKNNTRNYSLDLLRCIAMIMVVILHFLDKGGLLKDFSDGSSFTVQDVTAWILEALCIVAVNLYMLLSGYLLCESRFKVSNLILLVCRVWLYSVIVGFIGIALGAPNEPVDTYFLLRLLFPISMGTYWFMTAYIFFYLLVPVLGIAARSLKKKQLQVVLFGLIFFHAVIKSAVPATLTADAGGMDMIWYVVLYFVAVYIRKYAKEIKFAFIWYLIATLLIFGEAFVLRQVFLRTGSLSYILNISYAYNHIFVLASSVFLFMVFLKLKVSEKPGKIFAFLGKYSLGVYLLHENLSVRYAWEKLFRCDKISSAILLVIMAIIAGITVFVAGVIVDFIGRSIASFVLKIFGKLPGFSSIGLAVKRADLIFSKTSEEKITSDTSKLSDGE